MPSTVLHAEDWRIDLLKEHGLGTSEKELKESMKDDFSDLKEFEQAFKELGSEEYDARDRAQKTLISKGARTLKFLRGKKQITSPEVKQRVMEIVRQLQNEEMVGQLRMVDIATRSLLKNRKSKDTGGLFYEWFGKDSLDCSRGYRQFSYQTPAKKAARVEKGQLKLLGKRPGEIDQRFVLSVKEWPGGKKLPDRFLISARVGAVNGRASLWHVGISVGKVKALFHPGFPGGAFRYEQVPSRTKYCENKEMGFTPRVGELYRMTLLVNRQKNGRIKLVTTIFSEDHPPFVQSIELAAKEFGGLNQISLDRSGHEGGDAIFDDLLIDLNPE